MGEKKLNLESELGGIRMIRVIVPVRIKKEYLEKYIDTVQILIQESRNEEGCLEYNLVSSDQNNFFYFIELWKNEKAFHNHIMTPHFKKLLPLLNEMLEESFPPEVYNSITPIFKRASVRDFEKRDVESSKIDNLLHAAMAAPTAGNQQPWEFIVIRNRAVLDSLSAISPYAGALKKSPVAIIVVSSPTGKKYPQNIEQDLSATTENILIQAVEEGLGAVWLGLAPEIDRVEKAREILNLSKDRAPFAMIPIGYPKSEVKPLDKFDPKKISFIE